MSGPGENNQNLCTARQGKKTVLRIRDNNSFHPGSRVAKIPDPGFGFAIKNLIIFLAQKTDAKFSKIRFKNVFPGSGFRGQKSTGSLFRIRNTEKKTQYILFLLTDL
jgi:hypothetical protein